jgi:hypothetical protein
MQQIRMPSRVAVDMCDVSTVRRRLIIDLGVSDRRSISKVTRANGSAHAK